MKYYKHILLQILFATLAVKTVFSQVQNSEAPLVPPQNAAAGNNLADNFKKSLFVVGEIVITGNRKTKPYVIERELTFKTGDSVYLSELVKQFELARQQLYNTRLFNDVVVAIKSFNGYTINISIDVKERWYLFPIPYFKPVDRNLSAWSKSGYNLNRVNYGVKLSYYNFTGRNDKLKIRLVTGYTKQLELSYDQPNADKSLKHGYGLHVLYTAQKELNVNTANNDQYFLKADSISYASKYLYSAFNAGITYYYRPAIRTRHAIKVSYTINKVDSAVTVINPAYFNKGKTKIAYPEIAYTVDYNNMDYIAYPQKGFNGAVELIRRGWDNDMNLTQLNAKATKAWKIPEKFSVSMQFIGTLKLPFKQPFINQRMMGFGEFYLRGMEKYVIDGVAGALLRNTLRRQLFSFNIKNFRKKSVGDIPFTFYAKTYTDVGYSCNKLNTQNSLVNKMLYTAGAGVDVVTLYDLIFRFEYSFNQLGQGGFFFHIKNDF
jgi:Surface antigen variable number repeat